MKTLQRLFLAIFVLGTLSLGGCDWVQYAFMNSIPIEGDPAKNPEFRIYLGIDGLSWHVTKKAIEEGAFSNMGMNLSRFLTMFPGTSDASWTRILHTKKLDGYEMGFYSPETDSLHHTGLMGAALHVMPNIVDSVSFDEPYIKSFDYHANGYSHSLEAYRDTFLSLAESIDNLMFLLEGRIQTESDFTGYLLEFDVMGHMQSFDDAVKGLKILSKRLEDFQAQHPERKVKLTILSDHGMDFIRVPGDNFIIMKDQLPKVGITPVTSLRDHDPKHEIFAVPVEHVRVTYMALHTVPELIDEVAERVSQLESVDLAVSKTARPEDAPDSAPAGTQWYALRSKGVMAAYFGFDPAKDNYYLPASIDWKRFSMDIPFDSGEKFKTIDDDHLFQLVKLSGYPDLFYRVRTALSTVSTEYPADVLVSFRPTWAAMGFQLPFGAKDIASSGFHGALEELGTLGTLLTNERKLPDAVRSDTFLELFPHMKDHIRKRGVTLIDGDPNASLNYNP